MLYIIYYILYIIYDILYMIYYILYIIYYILYILYYILYITEIQPVFLIIAELRQIQAPEIFRKNLSQRFALTLEALAKGEWLDKSQPLVDTQAGWQDLNVYLPNSRAKNCWRTKKNLRSMGWFASSRCWNARIWWGVFWSQWDRARSIANCLQSLGVAVLTALPLGREVWHFSVPNIPLISSFGCENATTWYFFQSRVTVTWILQCFNIQNVLMWWIFLRGELITLLLQVYIFMKWQVPTACFVKWLFSMLPPGRIRLSAKGVRSHCPALATILPHEAPLRCRRDEKVAFWVVGLPGHRIFDCKVCASLFPSRYSLQSFLGTFAEPSQLRFWFKQVWYYELVTGHGWIHGWNHIGISVWTPVNNLFRLLGAICSLRRCRRNVL